MEKGRISMEELSQKLAAGKKIMNKVEKGDYSKGSVSEDVLKSPEELNESIMQSNGQSTGVKHKTPSPITQEKINQTNLPDNIKRAMIENPIPQIGLDSTLDMNFVEKTKKLMEQDGTIPRREGSGSQSSRAVAQSEPQTLQYEGNDLQLPKDIELKLTPIIENIIRKTFNEIVDKKLNQLLSASKGQTINENLAIKVGETIFTGKLTKAKTSK